MKIYAIDTHVFAKAGYDFSLYREVIEAAGYEFIMETCRNEEEVVQRCADADAIINTYVKMTEKSMSRLKNCKVMVRTGVGYDSFDVDAATSLGIKICNIPTYCSPEVATHTTALLLAAARNLLLYTMNVRAGEFDQTDGKNFPVMHRPSARTVGLVGFGRISRIVAKQLKGIDYNVVAYDPYLDSSVFAEMDVQKMELDELFAVSDIICTLTPYTGETHHIIDAAAIGEMKDGVILVNTARGALIDETALIEGLRSGKIAAAGLDVFETEPFNDPNHPLCRMDNVILTPHAAYRTAESSKELLRQAAQTAVSILQGKDLPNIVNKAALAAR